MFYANRAQALIAGLFRGIVLNDPEFEDLDVFGVIKKCRDRLFHGELEDTRLPLDETRALVVRYLEAHLQTSR